jgi:hypothetical protein
VAECSEVAYKTLSVQSARKFMLLDSDQALAQYIEQKHPDWKVGAPTSSPSVPL